MTLLPTIVKIVTLGIAVGAVIALTPTLIALEEWVFLAIAWVVAAVLVAVYITHRAVPAKYLAPGAIFLTLFIITPILMTVQLSFTNYGDGTRTSKEVTISRIIATSGVQTDSSRRFTLSVGTPGNVDAGPFTFFLVDNATGDTFSGDETGLVPLGPDDATVTDGTITAVPGYTLLTRQQVNTASQSGGGLDGFAVPTDNGAITALGFDAVELFTPLKYNEETGRITNVETGVEYWPQRVNDRSFFMDADGNRLSTMSWGENVGWANFQRIFTDPRITRDFASIFVWTVMFAFGSVLTTFVLGLGLALALNDPRMRGQKVYRSILLLPYAIPGFISLMVWSGFWNTEFGLVNDLLGTNINWFGTTFWARIAVLATNLWMGFPYMFLVSTGALQAIPGDLKEAASIDGASGFTQFRKITLPLVLVTTAPLLVASFAFNFNNFNVIQLLTEGGPFTPANPTAGGTDILISYTYRIAFGMSGQQIGFASAVSVVLFIITGVLAALQFRGTRALEDVN